MELELNIPYTQTELVKELGISRTTFNNRKEDYLFSLQLAYNFTMTKHQNSWIYIFTEKKDEWEKPLVKSKVESNKEQIKKFIKQVIQKDNLQTAANINRIAWQNDSVIQHLGLKFSTTGEYIRVCMKEMFGKEVLEGGDDGEILRKVWARLDKDNNKYLPLADELIQEYFGLIQKGEDVMRDKDAEIFSDYQEKEISRKEMIAMLGTNAFNKFQTAMVNFRDKYHFIPIKVPEYMLNQTLTKEEMDKALAREAAYGLELESFGR